MEGLFEEVCRVAAETHPRQFDVFIQYGTAGFRRRASDLDHVMFRMGMLAVLRSKLLKKAIGVMITASHNPEEDNGVKLVDPLGDMLEMSWEKHATRLANVSDSELGKVLHEISQSAGVDFNNPAKVILGKDTRPSSESLAQAVADGVRVLQAELQDYGLLTTPQLHYMVRCQNTGEMYGVPTEEGYYQKLAQAFLKLRNAEADNGNYISSLIIDAANGIGAPKMKQLSQHLSGKLNTTIYNDGSGKLNYMCGADYVKVQQKAPEGFNLPPGVRGASFDGDADRLVYYYIDEGGHFNLLDGDKIATLVAGYLQDVVQASGLDLDFGLVQTAYSNGSSTDYINNKLKVPVACVPTGVKHLHHRAQQYDIGVYFEANGHGTVLFSDQALEKIKVASQGSNTSIEQQKQAAKLLSVVDMINQTVGDAISDLLLVETVLHARGWNVQDWNTAYTDLPNRQLKVKVNDRTVIRTTDAERKTTAPPGLQEAIDDIVAKYPKGRSFVRPSGTEDVVRIYAESDTREHCDQLAYEVGMKAFELAGGVGTPPTPPQ